MDQDKYEHYSDKRIEVFEKSTNYSTANLKLR